MRLLRKPGVALFVLFLAAGVPGCSRSPQGGTATTTTERTVAVAAASDLKFALDEVLAEFHKTRPDVRVQVTYGSSGNFFAQLSNQAPFDLFLSADVDYPRRLIEAGHGVKESEFVYAIGHLVIWVPRDSPLDVEKLGVKAVLDPAARKVAVGRTRLTVLAAGETAGKGYVSIRAEDVILEAEPASTSSARNRLPGRVLTLSREGPMVRVGLDCGFALTALITEQACREIGLREGDAVTALLKAQAIHFIPR